LWHLAGTRGAKDKRFNTNNRKITEKDWDNFINSLNKDIERLGLNTIEINNKEQLNKCWNLWDNLIRSKANKHIPYSYTTTKEEENATPKAPAMIAEKINKRLNQITNLTDLQTQTIDTQNLEPVHFNCVKTPNELITEPEEIKNATHLHFISWMKANPYNEKEFKKWEGYYTLLPIVNKHTFSSLEDEISLAKL
ncbi:7188_t:CDS:2, partial [Gigaspora margarita]